MSVDYLSEDKAPTREDIDGGKGLVVLEFGTDWCGFCRAAAPEVESFVRQNPAVRHLKVEDGPGRPLGRSFRVRLWPSLVFLRDGAVVRQLSRPSASDLREAFEALTAPAP
ncbi:MAG TPA: thioredoxin family protein [Vicinamibacteria bacterium]|nr:thioredoxin family protein [Vicinamibacteria bacterium]